MHILLAILGVLGAAAFWWFRIKHIGKAASEVADTAKTVKGVWNRRRFRRKADAAAIDAIDDPRTAAAVLLVALAGYEGAMTARQEDAIRDALRDTMSSDRPQEELAFARWAARDVTDPNNLTLKLSKIWARHLDASERRQLLDVARRVVEAGGAVSEAQREALVRLEQRLGL